MGHKPTIEPFEDKEPHKKPYQKRTLRKPIHKPVNKPKPNSKPRQHQQQPHHLRPENLPDGPWKRKLLREKAESITRSKAARSYSKIRRQHAHEVATQEAAKAKAKSSGTVIIVPDVEAQNKSSKKRTHHDGDEMGGGKEEQDEDGESTDSSEEHFHTASDGEAGSSWSEEEEVETTPGRRNGFEAKTRPGDSMLDNAAATGERENYISPNSESDSESESKLEPTSNSKSMSGLSRPFLKLKSVSKPHKSHLYESQDRDQEHEHGGSAEEIQESSGMHPSRASLLASHSYLSTAAQKQQRRLSKLEHRRLDRENRNQDRLNAIADRERMRKLMRKAKEVGPDGKRKLGREGTVLYEQVKKLVGPSLSGDNSRDGKKRKRGGKR
ncbi:hypothetical protein MKZ38_000168 [Zalerion maritima]|uniref:Uncharacterized protein n=1 Tax=Zalerion maritima TaxID=339359 RepID=A0AAD5RRS8_9PEZI|nr:hypothetical protein MKZ38_000168 [Zalerion maritima]